MKKILPLLIGLLVLGIVVFFGFRFLGGKDKNTESEPSAAAPKLEVVNQLPLKDRPFVTIKPISQTRPQDLGSWITVEVSNVKTYEKVKYDVEYQSGSLIQGFSHQIDLTESPPFAKEGFFGSESKGKYKYDEDVGLGNILLKFYKNSSDYDALKTYFNLQNAKETEGIFTSNDVKATLKTTELDNSWYLVIASTLGLPAKTEKQVISEPYGFYAHKEVSLDEAALTIKSSEDLTGAEILGWDEESEEWLEYETKTEEGQATAIVDRLTTFVLVK
jgi:hypothetical protein